MRSKINTQSEFNFQPSNLQITNAYYAKYEAISATLDEHPEIVDAVHRDLAEAAAEERLIEGDQLRLDTTAVETNIHWPTDSSLLWDTYRTLARVIDRIREMDPARAGRQQAPAQESQEAVSEDRPQGVEGSALRRSAGTPV